jgi:invasion protein IalB
MVGFAKAALAIGAAALMSAGVAGAALAQTQQAGTQRPIPKKWSYEIKNGKRVPRANRVTNPDGSWREEVTRAGCVTVREKTAAGEYRESVRCG